MARFCTECGSALTEGSRFCVECGAPAAADAAAPDAAAPPAAPEPAAPRPAPAAVPTPRAQATVPPPRAAPVPPPAAVTPPPAPVAAPKAAKRRGGCGCLTVLLVLLVLFFGATAAAAWYVIAPDLPPGGPLALLPDTEELRYRLPIVGGGSALEPLPAETQLRAAVARSAAAADPQRAQDRVVQQQLAATGLPVTVVSRTMTPSGKPALVVGMDAAKLMTGLQTDGGLASSVNAVVRLVKSNALNVTSVDHVIVAIHDAQGRVLFSMASPSSAITQFRDGKITQKDFLKRTAVEPQSRAGLIQEAGRWIRDSDK